MNTMKTKTAMEVAVYKMNAYKGFGITALVLSALVLVAAPRLYFALCGVTMTFAVINYVRFRLYLRKLGKLAREMEVEPGGITFED